MFASFASFPLPLPLLLSVLLLLHLPFSLAFAQFSSSSSSSVSPSLCNPREDSLFLADSSDRRAFFQCRAFAQLPSVGFWERHFCPFGMHFAYATQQCTANSLPTEVIRDRNELFQIAILNGSCANGERCIGGTVCDRTERRCLCPFGTMAVLENLFCAAIPTVKQPQKETNPWHDQWQQQMLANSIFQLRTAQNGDEIGKSNAQKTKEFERTTQEKFKKASLGEKCNDFLGEFCADQNARCEESRCRCVVPMVEQNGKCQQLTIKEAGPGELCNGGQKCVGGTKCHPKTAICVCSRDTELKKGRCERRGEAEESDAAKERANEETAKGSQAETGTDATPPAEMVPISSAEEKSPKGSRKKAKKASVGEKCSLNAECLSGAYCNGNTQPPTCQCLSTHVKVNDRCEKVIYPGQRGCETDLQCSAAYAGTRCIGRQCVCPPGSTPIDKSCIPDGKSDANCTNCSVLPNKSSTSELQRKPNGPFAKLYHQKNSKGNKISVPGELCGPFESCAGGSSCVEGFCLCPAGTRPSPASGNCETFAQQRKMTKTLAEGRKSERNGTETEKGTAPKAIAERRANQTPNEPTNVPIADPLKNLSKSGPTPNVPIAADPRSPLTDVRSLRIFNQNLTGRETRTLSTDAKKIVNIVPNLLQNATEINVKERAYARPSESCSNGEICTGGSICDQKNKICECPSAKRMLRNHICIRSNELPMIEAKVVKPGELCDSETKCVGNSVCVEGSCRCRKRELRKEANEENGEKDRRDLKKGEALPPVQLKLRNEEEDEQLDGSAPPPSSVSRTKRRVRMHARPRISGPPLRRPSPSSPSLAPAGTNGVCPRGNAPLIDQKSGLLVQCNGMTPNCPPKSYCFVTGVASEVYNCCKSY